MPQYELNLATQFWKFKVWCNDSSFRQGWTNSAMTDRIADILSKELVHIPEALYK